MLDSVRGKTSAVVIGLAVVMERLSLPQWRGVIFPGRGKFSRSCLSKPSFPHLRILLLGLAVGGWSRHS